ncbi:MAG: molybdopterin converting factor subunit 1 [Rhodospirillales bacterium]|nr:molybdopterin converting factor subunit 1 [Rhodospirillales bacterium]
MKILYFAYLREKAGIAEEDIELPADVTDVRGLIAWLVARGGGPAEALADSDLVHVALNQEHVDLDRSLHDVEEVAFFPPVTGG